MFHEFVWDKATSIYFLRKRIKFIDINGEEGEALMQIIVSLLMGIKLTIFSKFIIIR